MAGYFGQQMGEHAWLPLTAKGSEVEAELKWDKPLRAGTRMRLLEELNLVKADFRDAQAQVVLEPVRHQAAMAPVAGSEGGTLPTQEHGLVAIRQVMQFISHPLRVQLLENSGVAREIERTTYALRVKSPFFGSGGSLLLGRRCKKALPAFFSLARAETP